MFSDCLKICYLVLPSLLLFEVPQPLFFGTEQLVLVIYLLLLPQRHRAKLTQCELHPFPQLWTTEKYVTTRKSGKHIT